MIYGGPNLLVYMYTRVLMYLLFLSNIYIIG
jgi:hypothetical protein